MTNKERDVVIVAHGRSAVSRAGKNGILRQTHPVEFGSAVLKGVLAQVPALKGSEIDEVVVGCAIPSGVQGDNMARLIALRSELPATVTAQTINRFCSSGLQAIATGTNSIIAGDHDVVIAGGVETMSLVAMMSDPATHDQWLVENEPGAYMPMGTTAENVAEKYGITREEMDDFAVESHRRADFAQRAGYFKDEIIPVMGHDAEGNPVEFKEDQGIRAGTTREILAGLPTVFKADGRVTAGNSSQLSSGAGFVVLMTAAKAKELELQPLARLRGFATGGVDPTMMGIGPLAAVPKLLERLDLSVADLDVIELNEAFAAQALPVIRELKLDPAKVNPNGGAIALGHPLGATGAILVTKALHHLEKTKGKTALITMCIGGGMGAAGIIERL